MYVRTYPSNDLCRPIQVEQRLSIDVGGCQRLMMSLRQCVQKSANLWTLQPVTFPELLCRSLQMQVWEYFFVSVSASTFLDACFFVVNWLELPQNQLHFCCKHLDALFLPSPYLLSLSLDESSNWLL